MFEVDVVPDEGEPYRVTATSRDITQWEKRVRGASLGSIQRDIKMTALTELAYFASLRHGHFQGSLDEFRESVDITPITPDEDDDEDDGDELGDEAGPTQSAPSPGASSRSRSSRASRPTSG